MSKTRPITFTLIELLVVIAIISVLCCILLPALKGTMDKVRQIACVNNMKQVGLAAGMYSGDYNDWCITSGYTGLTSGKNYWNSVLVRELNYMSWDAAICPLNKLPLYGDYDSGYGLNASTFGFAQFGGNTGMAKTTTITSFGTSSSLILITENAYGTYSGYHNYAGYGVSRYSGHMGFYMPGDDSNASRYFTISLRHRNQANALIFDGHVEPLFRATAFDMQHWNPIQKVNTNIFEMQ